MTNDIPNTPPSLEEITSAMAKLDSNDPDIPYMVPDLKAGLNELMTTMCNVVGWDDERASIEVIPMAFAMGVEIGRDVERQRAFIANFGGKEEA